MISAFGVEHFSKSYVPGQGFKSASKLDAIERHIVRNATLGGKNARKLVGTTEQRAAQKQKRGGNRTKIYEDIPTKQRGKLTKVVANRAQTGRPSSVQGFSQPDGRGGGRVVIHDDADFASTARHEMAHIAPKRNPVNFFDRVKDPKRLGKEEGRADFRAHGKQTNGQYPGGEDFQQGYNEVQGKMAAAKWRKNQKR